jgi:hypothetical protein
MAWLPAMMASHTVWTYADHREAFSSRSESAGAGTHEVGTQLIGPVVIGSGTESAQPQSAPHCGPDWTAIWFWPPSPRKSWAATVQRAGINGSAARTQEEIGQALRVIVKLLASGVPLPGSRTGCWVMLMRSMKRGVRIGGHNHGWLTALSIQDWDDAERAG